MTDAELQAIKARWPQYKPEMGIDSFGAARTDVLELVAEVERLRAQLAAVRIASQAYKALAAICPECGGSGEVDSGGFTPWGVGINETCPACKGSGKAYNDADGAE